ncbi:MAG TPA: alkaline phosphatase family protein [Solirubrobacteraceae bacterium]|nr:alkaline phosphatase family protein [Solirubrobacteraceae bacterium]
MTRLTTAALVAVMAAAAFASGSAGASCGPVSGAVTGARVACPSASASRSRAGYSHVVVVIEENYSGSAIVGGGQAPYLKSLAAQGEYFPNYHGVTHPSEPNYLALFTGSTQHTDGSDSCIKTSAKSIVGDARSAGISIKGYIEGLSSGSGYACRHDPFSQIADARRAETDFSKFPTNYATLPNLSFVVPNLTHDMHDNGIGPGDRWARAHLSGYAQWAKKHNSLLIVISDENDADSNYSGNQPGENGNGALALVVGARIAAGKSNSSHFDHYSMLRTLEDIFGLAHLGASASASDMIAP